MRWERFNSDKICLVTYARIQVLILDLRQMAMPRTCVRHANVYDTYVFTTRLTCAKRPCHTRVNDTPTCLRHATQKHARCQRLRNEFNPCMENEKKTTCYKNLSCVPRREIGSDRIEIGLTAYACLCALFVHTSLRFVHRASKRS
jgi:hypothetical protein